MPISRRDKRGGRAWLWEMSHIFVNPTFQRLSPHRGERVGVGEHAQLKAALTRSGRNGVRRKRTPVASNTALPTAAAVGQVAGSPAPYAGYSGVLLTSTTSMLSGISANCRIG